jgi:hypothetical protein
MFGDGHFMVIGEGGKSSPNLLVQIDLRSYSYVNRNACIFLFSCSLVEEESYR